MKLVTYVLPLLLLALLLGCARATDGDSPQGPQSAFRFLYDQGYTFVSYEGQASSYTLTKDKIVEFPYMMYWGLMQVDPADYFGKTVEVEKYVVKDHPLVKGGRVDLMIYMVDGKPVGGNSFPHDEKLDGGYWSLDGKTLEELQPDDYLAWHDKWIQKYSQ